MGKVRLLVELSEEDYEVLKQGSTFTKGTQMTRIYEALWDATPLPKNQGNLIDWLEELQELREEKKLYFDKAFNSVDKTKLSDHLKNRLMQTAMNNMETIMPYSKVCEDIVDNRLDTWIEEVKS